MKSICSLLAICVLFGDSALARSDPCNEHNNDMHACIGDRVHGKQVTPDALCEWTEEPGKGKGSCKITNVVNRCSTKGDKKAGDSTRRYLEAHDMHHTWEEIECDEAFTTRDCKRVSRMHEAMGSAGCNWACDGTEPKCVDRPTGDKPFWDGSVVEPCMNWDEFYDELFAKVATEELSCDDFGGEPTSDECEDAMVRWMEFFPTVPQKIQEYHASLYTGSSTWDQNQFSYANNGQAPTMWAGQAPPHNIGNAPKGCIVQVQHDGWEILKWNSNDSQEPKFLAGNAWSGNGNFHQKICLIPENWVKPSSAK